MYLTPPSRTGLTLINIVARSKTTMNDSSGSKSASFAALRERARAALRQAGIEPATVGQQGPANAAHPKPAPSTPTTAAAPEPEAVSIPEVSFEDAIAHAQAQREEPAIAEAEADAVANEPGDERIDHVEAEAPDEPDDPEGTVVLAEEGDAQPEPTDEEVADAMDAEPTAPEDPSQSEDNPEPEPEEAETPQPEGPVKVFRGAIRAKSLAGICRLVTPLVNEAKVKLHPTQGLALKAVDPAHVAMVELHAPPRAFDATTGDELEVGLDFELLADHLKALKRKETVTFEANGHLVLQQGGLTSKLHVVDTSGMTDPKVPKLDLPGVARFKTDEFDVALRQAGVISDHVRISIKDGIMSTVAEGDTTRSEWVNAIRATGEGDSMFSLDFLGKMVKALKTAGYDEASIFLGKDYPCRIEAVSEEGITVLYLLAPRIESE